LLGVREDQLFLGNGSDEAIDLLYRAFCEPGRHNALTMAPSYGMFEVCAGINDVALKKIPLTSEFQLDTEKIIQAVDPQTHLIFFCSPNNPTGNLLDQDSIREVTRNFKGLVVVDEAYIDFAETESFISSLGDLPNLVILRTFSKAWGMAGVRLGMAVAGEKIIDILNKIKYPYNISLLAQQTVAGMLDKTGQRDEWVTILIKEREKLAEALQHMSMVEKIYPSETNFILVRFRDHNKVMRFLLNEKIVVRNRSHLLNCEGCLRITIGSEEDNALLVSKLILFEQINQIES
jgi:histidinol-phosphate aminotransferase